MEVAPFPDASFPHHLADLALLPAKMFPGLVLDTQESQYVEGTRAYVTFIKWIARLISNFGRYKKSTELMTF